MDLPTLWFALAVTCWVLFFVLEGFDFGVGVLAGALGRDDHERGAGVTTIGPVWDGNEVWLVAAVGVTFAAFPDWYAALMSGLYLPFVLILLALAARGVALEFRVQGRHRALARRVRRGARGLVAAGRGPVGRGARRCSRPGSRWARTARSSGRASGARVAPLVSTPGAARGGAGRWASALVQGATFLGLRTTGPLRARARVAALGALVPVAVLVAVVAPLGLVAVGGAGRPGGGPARGAGVRRRPRWPWPAASSRCSPRTCPSVLPSTLDPAFSLTVAGAAASPGALRLITIAAVLVLPGVRGLPGVLVLGVPPAGGQRTGGDVRGPVDPRLLTARPRGVARRDGAGARGRRAGGRHRGGGAGGGHRRHGAGDGHRGRPARRDRRARRSSWSRGRCWPGSSRGSRRAPASRWSSASASGCSTASATTTRPPSWGSPGTASTRCAGGSPRPCPRSCSRWCCRPRCWWCSRSPTRRRRWSWP